MSNVLLRIPSAEVPERVHRLDHTVFWQVRGSSRLILNDETSVTLREGCAAWVPSGTNHRLHVGEDSIVTPLSICARQHPSNLDALTVVRIEPHDKLFLLALWNCQSTIIQRPADLQRQVVAIMERSANDAELPMPRTPEAAAVARALVLEPGDDRRISEWAKNACMSGRSLERAFTAETGLSFGQWRKTCRMLAAARMLRSGDPVQVIAFRVGYENASSFARAFREFHGVRPKDYVAA